MKCNHCKTILSKDAVFCPNCGKRISPKYCYASELKEYREHLTRQTDIDSINAIIISMDAAFDADEPSAISCLSQLTEILSKYCKVYDLQSSAVLQNGLTDILNKTEAIFRQYRSENDIDISVEVASSDVEVEIIVE